MFNVIDNIPKTFRKSVLWRIWARLKSFERDLGSSLPSPFLNNNVLYIKFFFKKHPPHRSRLIFLQLSQLWSVALAFNSLTFTFVYITYTYSFLNNNPIVFNYRYCLEKIGKVLMNFFARDFVLFITGP